MNGTPVGPRPRRHRRARGQALVEFSLALIPFVLILMGAVDFGRGIYVYNGVAQAAREIARTTSVHPGADFTTSAGWSAETHATVATQAGLVPGIVNPTSVTIACTDMADNVVATRPCPATDFVRATVTVTFSVVTPLLNLANPMTFSSASHVQIAGPSGQ